MSLFRSKIPDPTPDDLFHTYTLDLVELNKLRQQAWQAVTLRKTPEALREVTQYDTMIDVAQKAVIRLTREREV